MHVIFLAALLGASISFAGDMGHIANVRQITFASLNAESRREFNIFVAHWKD